MTTMSSSNNAVTTRSTSSSLDGHCTMTSSTTKASTSASATAPTRRQPLCNDNAGGRVNINTYNKPSPYHTTYDTTCQYNHTDTNTTTTTTSLGALSCDHASLLRSARLLEDDPSGDTETEKIRPRNSMERGKDNDDCNNENKNQPLMHPPNSSRSQNRMRRNNSSTTSSDSEEDDSSLQDALATSSALVGENVLDSPIPSSHHKHHHHHHNKSNNLCMPSLPASMPSSSSQTTVTTTTPTYPHNTLNAYQHHHHAATVKSDEFSVGLMAQGLAWVRRQRERRQRLYLQNQAEQQLRILQEATLTPAQQQHAHVSSYSSPWDNPCTGSRGLLDNPTFQSLAASHSTTTSQQQSYTEDKEKQMLSSSSLLDDPTCISNYPSASSSALAADHDERSTVPVVSPSGDGYTVKLPSSVTDMDEQEDASWIPPVRVQEPGATTASTSDSSTLPPYLLTPAQMQQIATHVLPRGISYCKWTRLYSLARDGDSFDACLRLLQGQKNTLLVLRTSRNHILGGFADQPWDKARNMPGSASYYGGPDACLFTFAPPPSTVDKLDSKNSNRSNKMRFYKWTGANRYIQLCDVAHKMLAFGGGGEEGDFGLCVEQDFQRGSTGHCATFDNDPLCDPDTFSILDVEIYGFLLGQF